ncbi:MAG: SpoIIE family protein phosphatase [Bacteroidia bacterium]|nr:SpoIIE family protein phosphatase [Bacteroidia bacterium]
MFNKTIDYIKTRGVAFEISYQDKKDLVAYNTTFLWTTVLIFVNIFVAFASGLHAVAFVNFCATLGFSALILFNHFGLFKVIKHVGIILANLYVFFQSVTVVPDLQFQYAYCIILTMIGLVFSQRKYLYIHLPITVLFFIVTKIAYHYIEPAEHIPLDQRDYFAMNNGIIFLILISVSAVVFRKQTNIYLDEIEQKKNLIEEKQKEIYDSINYAKRIQSAILNNTELIDVHLHKDKYFILFEPKDIVSGDFYWAAYVKAKDYIKIQDFEVRISDDLLYIAVCDSTGHGVTGAFMSLLNMGFLNESIKEKHIYEPDKIFDYVRHRLVESISDEGQKDGFDGILLCINKTSGQISYTAANNNPVLVSQQGIVHLPADKMPVGKGQKEDRFKLYPIHYKTGDKLYLYTDGYPDQFGGPKGKKFKYRQLEELLLTCSPLTSKELNTALRFKFEEWKGELEQVDDVCLMGIEL